MTIPPKPKGYWQPLAKLLAEQAKTMSNNQLAELHNTTKYRMRQQLAKMGIKPAKHATGREARNAELAKLGLTHTPSQIAKASGKTIRAIYQELKRYGIQAQYSIPNCWEKRSAQLREAAKTMTVRQLADSYGVNKKYMYSVLARFGISAKPAHPGRTAGSKTQKPATPKPAVTPAQAAQQPQLRKPATQSMAKKPPAAIVWPAHIQVQHLALPQQPESCRVCNGSSTKAYVPAKDWRTGPRAI